MKKAKGLRFHIGDCHPNVSFHFHSQLDQKKHPPVCRGVVLKTVSDTVSCHRIAIRRCSANRR